MFGFPKEPLGTGAVLRPCRNWTSRGPMGFCAYGMAVFIHFNLIHSESFLSLLYDYIKYIYEFVGPYHSMFVVYLDDADCKYLCGLVFTN